MNRQTRRGATALALFGTASFLTIAATTAAQAQGNAPPVEEVLVTGSLIRGGAAIGVPVTALSTQDFRETGAVTISDMLRSQPAIAVQLSNPVMQSGGAVFHDVNVEIHAVPSANANETLLMIDGVRFPFQGLGQDYVDPSIIPQLAVDRIDVLADGASATYGSDALAGVVNVVLKHGFDGAISKIQYSRSTDIGGDTVDASQLYGRKWDSGSVNVTYEVTHVSAIHGPARDYFTANYEPYGFDDQTSIGDAVPGVVSTGSLKTLANNFGFAAKTGTRFCTNCYSIPVGSGWNYGDTPAHTNPTAPGSVPTTTWTALLANPGVKNLHNPDSYTDVEPGQETSQAVLTFDQDLFDGLSVFAEAFYFDRRSTQHMIPGASPEKWNAMVAVPVPTTNPYYPAGAPAGLRVSYNLAQEDEAVMQSGEHGGRYNFGFNAKLPYDWNGKLYYSSSRNDGYVTVINTANGDAISAALGNTVTQGLLGNTSLAKQFTPFTKPDNVPYLNPFCDSTQFKCNSPATLAYIAAHRDYKTNWIIGEGGANFDGPVVDLPGGTMKAAVGAVTYSDHTLYSQYFTADTDTPNVVYDPSLEYTDWAVFAQTDIPLIGEMNKLPGVESLTVQLGIRHDDYNTFGSVTTPKVAVNWALGWGLKLNADWGRAFRVPIGGESSAVNGSLVEPYNILGGDVSEDLTLSCGSVRGSKAGVANPGTLNAYLNPTCSNVEELANPGGIFLQGGGHVADPVRPGNTIGPEKSINWNLAVDFAPTDFLKGLDLGLVWYNLKIKGTIAAADAGLVGDGGNDPSGKVCTAPATGCVFFVRANPNLPITDPANAAFLNYVNLLFANPRANLVVADIGNLQFIEDDAAQNIGYEKIGGLDFHARYDFDLADYGAWNVGLTGNYQLINESQTFAGTPVISVFKGQNSGGRLAYRGRVGWAASGGEFDGLSITGFVNYIPHSSVSTSSRNVPPKCYWAAGYSAGSCYPGSPYWGPYSVFPTFSPGLYTFDLSLGYETGTKPANTYLQNLNFQVTVNDILNKAPPYERSINSGRAAAAFVETTISPLQRTINIAITKVW